MIFLSVNWLIMFIQILNRLLQMFNCEIIFFEIIINFFRVFSNCILYNGEHSEVG